VRGNPGHCPDTQQSPNNLFWDWADPSLPQSPPHQFLKDVEVNSFSIAICIRDFKAVYKRFYIYILLIPYAERSIRKGIRPNSDVTEASSPQGFLPDYLKYLHPR